MGEPARRCSTCGSAAQCASSCSRGRQAARTGRRPGEQSSASLMKHSRVARGVSGKGSACIGGGQQEGQGQGLS